MEIFQVNSATEFLHLGIQQRRKVQMLSLFYPENQGSSTSVSSVKFTRIHDVIAHYT
jgi:hypothetical protein